MTAAFVKLASRNLTYSSTGPSPRSATQNCRKLVAVDESRSRNRLISAVPRHCRSDGNSLSRRARYPGAALRASPSPTFRKKWCPGTGSNRRHCDFQSHALPTELPGRGRWPEPAIRKPLRPCPALPRRDPRRDRRKTGSLRPARRAGRGRGSRRSRKGRSGPAPVSGTAGRA